MWEAQVPIAFKPFLPPYTCSDDKTCFSWSNSPKGKASTVVPKALISCSQIFVPVETGLLYLSFRHETSVAHLSGLKISNTKCELYEKRQMNLYCTVLAIFLGEWS